MRAFLEGVVERAAKGDPEVEAELRKQLQGPHAAFLRQRLETRRPPPPAESTERGPAPVPVALSSRDGIADAADFRHRLREAPAQAIEALPTLPEGDRLASVRFAIAHLHDGEEEEIGLALAVLERCELPAECIQDQVRQVADAQLRLLLRAARTGEPIGVPARADFLRASSRMPEPDQFAFLLRAGLQLAGVRAPTDYHERPPCEPFEPWATRAAEAAAALVAGRSDHDRQKLGYLLGALGRVSTVLALPEATLSLAHVAMGLVAHGNPACFAALLETDLARTRMVRLQQVELLVRLGRVEEAEVTLDADSARARLALVRAYEERRELPPMIGHWEAIATDVPGLSRAELALRQSTRADIALRIAEVARTNGDEATARTYWHRARTDAAASVAGTVMPLPFAERFAHWRPDDGEAGLDDWHASALAALRDDGLEAALASAESCPRPATVVLSILIESGNAAGISELERWSRRAPEWVQALGLAAAAHLLDETRDFERAREWFQEAQELAESLADDALRAEVLDQLIRLRAGLSAFS